VLAQTPPHAVYQQGFQALEDADAAHTSTHLQVAPGFAARTRTFSCNKLTWATALVLPSESTALTHLLSDLARGAGAALACNHCRQRPIFDAAVFA
jgi:hypothetical protein